MTRELELFQLTEEKLGRIEPASERGYLDSLNARIRRLEALGAPIVPGSAPIWDVRDGKIFAPNKGTVGDVAELARTLTRYVLEGPKTVEELLSSGRGALVELMGYRSPNSSVSWVGEFLPQRPSECVLAGGCVLDDLVEGLDGLVARCDRDTPGSECHWVEAGPFSVDFNKGVATLVDFDPYYMPSDPDALLRELEGFIGQLRVLLDRARRAGWRVVVKQ